jgi:hypothetical protein
VSFAVAGKSSNLIRENYLDEQFGASPKTNSIMRARAYPSIVMRARNNTITNINRRTSMILHALSLEQEEMLAVDEVLTNAEPRKKKSGAGLVGIV